MAKLVHAYRVVSLVGGVKVDTDLTAEEPMVLDNGIVRFDYAGEMVCYFTNVVALTRTDIK